MGLIGGPITIELSLRSVAKSQKEVAYAVPQVVVPDPCGHLGAGSNSRLIENVDDVVVDESEVEEEVEQDAIHGEEILVGGGVDDLVDCEEATVGATVDASEDGLEGCYCCG